MCFALTGFLDELIPRLDEANQRGPAARKDDEDQPGAPADRQARNDREAWVHEIGGRGDERDEAGGARTQAIDERFQLPVAALQASPVLDHASLRQGERGENGDRVQR